MSSHDLRASEPAVAVTAEPLSYCYLLFLLPSPKYPVRCSEHGHPPGLGRSQNAVRSHVRATLWQVTPLVSQSHSGPQSLTV